MRISGGTRTYAAESEALDAEILAAIHAWHRGDDVLDEDAFNHLALRLFAYQLRYNDPYARYCATLDITPSALPQTWEGIPPAPATAFKDFALTTFDPSRAALVFATSGTTTGRPGRHFFETAALYDAALIAGFDRFMLPDGARLLYFNLVADPAERPDSSLGYMMHAVARARGVSDAGWYVRGDELRLDAFVADLREAIAAGSPVCIAATAFALVHLLDRLALRNLSFTLPPGSRVMETGGFKGRTRSLEPEPLYLRISRSLDLPPESIVAEYGMTELTSQYYDDVFVSPRARTAGARRKLAPPWLRTRVVGPDGATLPAGTIGALVHVDLANRSSCIAISTEDLGAQTPGSTADDAPGLVLLGRDAGASLRGCSLDAEMLRSL